MKIERLKNLCQRLIDAPNLRPESVIGREVARALLAGIAEAERLATPERNADEYRAGKQTAAEAILAAMEDAT